MLIVRAAEHSGFTQAAQVSCTSCKLKTSSKLCCLMRISRQRLSHLVNKVLELLLVNVNEPHLSRVPQCFIDSVCRRMDVKLQHTLPGHSTTTLSSIAFAMTAARVP